MTITVQFPELIGGNGGDIFFIDEGNKFFKGFPEFTRNVGSVSIGIRNKMSYLCFALVFLHRVVILLIQLQQQH